MTGVRLDILAEGLNHPEGVVWSPFDECLYAGGEEGEIYAVTLAGEVELLAGSGGSMLGLAVDGRGRVYACDAGRGTIVRLDPSTREIETYGCGADGRLDTPNVAAFGPDGCLYVTCSGEGGRAEIVRIPPGGEVETWTTAVSGYPNGCLVTPDGSALVVVEATAERVVRVAIRDDGAAGGIETVAELPDTDPDGIALDADGGLWATLYRPDGIVRIDAGGGVDVIVDDHLARTLSAPTNIAFAGVDLDRAVIANVGGRYLLVADVGVRGQPLHYPEVP